MLSDKQGPEIAPAKGDEAVGAAVAEAEERYQQLIANAPFGVILVRQGIVVRTNQAMLRILRTDRDDELVGHPVLDMIHPAYRAQARERLGRLMARQAAMVEPLEQPLLRSDGTLARAIIYGQTVTIRGEVLVQGFVADISERALVEDELRRTRDHWARTFDVLDDAVVIYSTDKHIKLMNQRAKELFDVLFVETDGRVWLRQFHAHGQRRPDCPVCSTFATGDRATFEVVDSEGGRVFEGRSIPWPAPDGEIETVVLVIRDVTEQRRGEQHRRALELQLLQAHKMESIGRLAGGIAHDFNNLLTAILGYSDVALAKVPAEHPVVDLLRRVRGAGERAATLTRQLLAFSRTQVLATSATDVNAVILEFLRIVERIIGEDIVIETRLASKVPALMVDPGQLEQVLLNLVVNARDAMPTGGRLLISTETLMVGGEDVESLAAAFTDRPEPGTYVKLVVKDSGIGIPPDVLPLVFEPFFTTKERDKGTGLGLSTVYGVVKQHRGHLGVASVQGKGTAFTILLPVVAVPDGDVAQLGAVADVAGGTETVLVVDDDDLVRQLVATVLDALGYRVLSASDAAAAMALAQQDDEKIDLLLTDVVMPSMHGMELAERLKALRPSLKVAFMSGYPDDHLPRGELDTIAASLIEKPLTPAALGRFVRAQLDRPR